jgi:hypothetical protein
MRASRESAALLLRKWETENTVLRGTFSLYDAVDIIFRGTIVRLTDKEVLLAHSVGDPVLGTVTISMDKARDLEFQTAAEGPPGDSISANVENALIIRFDGALLGLFEQRGE